MRHIKSYPPNIGDIKTSGLPFNENTVFCYGDTIYCLQDEIPEDILFHEKIHSLQQQGKPEIWWKKYCYDKEFRLEQELEAYTRQYQLIKDKINNKVAKEALDEFATNLSLMYNIGITKSQAETAIRKYAIR